MVTGVLWARRLLTLPLVKYAVKAAATTRGLEKLTLRELPAPPVGPPIRRFQSEPTPSG